MTKQSDKLVLNLKFAVTDLFTDMRVPDFSRKIINEKCVPSYHVTPVKKQ